MKVAVLVVLGLLIAAAVAWDAGEHHYDNCVAVAKERNPLPSTRNAWDHLPDPLGILDPEDEALRTEVRLRLQNRKRAIDGCSRLPW
jgi:hypothetical protein